MRQATFVCTHWQPLLSAFQSTFTRPGHRRFVGWITASALNAEEYTVTQSVVAIERTCDWKALVSFAEYRAWHSERITAVLTALTERAPGRLWHGYHVHAVDDTKVHRSGQNVWGDLHVS
jgi:hypothetical protein